MQGYAHRSKVWYEVVFQVLGDLQQHDASQLWSLWLCAVELGVVYLDHQFRFEGRLLALWLGPILPSCLRKAV